ncbi:SpoIIE family protein phosphatase [Actinomadura mexicana]|uniref:SpoIIE family protein phosphatase n=1 Tax=Actinomadura mexicana TaxID=134959 RepID=UPI001FE9826C|nr:SpoIIE family protein phosphatase [Actinomadura mexicana]
MGREEEPGPAVATAVVDDQGLVAAWSPGAQQMLGYIAEDVLGRPASLLLADAAPSPAPWRLPCPAPWSGEVPLWHKDGGRVSVELLAYPGHDSRGRTEWLVVSLTTPGISIEGIPGLGDARLLDLAFTQSRFAMAIHDRDLRLVRVNDLMCRRVDLTQAELHGRLLSDVLPGYRWRLLERYLRQVLDTGQPVHRETYRRVPGETRERNWSVFISPLKDRAGRTQAVWVGVLDNTEQYRARHRLTMLSDASTRIGTTLDVTKTAQELTDLVVPQFAELAIVDLLEAVLVGDEPGPGPLSDQVALRSVAYRSTFGDRPGTNPDGLDLRHELWPPARCLATGQAILMDVDDPEVVAATARHPAWAEAIGEHRLRSVLSVPVRARGVTLGVAAFVRGESAEPFEQDDVLLAEELTARAAVSIDNARRYTRERTTALTLQRSLLPHRLCEQSAVEAATCYLPASSHVGVSGDWFDVIPLSSARVALVVGDVVGHGIHASATMGRLRTAVRTLADIDSSPDELLTRLDDLVSRFSAETATDDYDEAENEVGATCLYAVYDPVSRRCTFARAGHPPPALIAPDGSVDFLDLPAGPPLGVGGLPFESTEVELPEDSILAFYTDGLVESRDHDIDVGLERLRLALTGQSSSLAETCDSVFKAALPPCPVDDAALLVVRTNVLDADRFACWDLPADPAVVAETRNLVAERLTRWGLDEAIYVTELIVSELVTNAIRYAKGPIQLRIIRDRTLICEVSDGTSTAPHLRRARLLDEGGRGLLLVAQLTQRWGTRHTPHGKTIWTEQPLTGTDFSGLLDHFDDLE